MRFKNNFTMVPFRMRTPAIILGYCPLGNPLSPKTHLDTRPWFISVVVPNASSGFSAVQSRAMKRRYKWASLGSMRNVQSSRGAEVQSGKAAREHSMKNWGIIPLVPLQLSFLPQTLPWCPRQTRHCLHPLLILSTSSLGSPT